MDVIFRRKDAAEYISFLNSIIEKMATTLYEVNNLVGDDWSLEDILEQYGRCAEGPTIFEQVLINKGELTKHECTRNYFERQLLDHLDFAIVTSKEINDDN